MAIEIGNDPSIYWIPNEEGPGPNQKWRCGSADGQGRSTKGGLGEGGEDIEKRSCDQESQLPTLAQVRPVEHIFPT